MDFLTFHSVGNFRKSQLTNSMIFQRGRYTTNQYSISLCIIVEIIVTVMEFTNQLNYVLRGPSMGSRSQFFDPVG